MASLFLYAEAVRQIMRAIQMLSMHDGAAAADAAALLKPLDLDDAELTGRLRDIIAAVTALAPDDDAMAQISDLARLSERIMERHLGTVEPPPTFAIHDPEADPPKA